MISFVFLSIQLRFDLFHTFLQKIGKLLHSFELEECLYRESDDIMLIGEEDYSNFEGGDTSRFSFQHSETLEKYMKEKLQKIKLVF